MNPIFFVNLKFWGKNMEKKIWGKKTKVRKYLMLTNELEYAKICRGGTITTLLLELSTPNLCLTLSYLLAMT